MPDSQVPLKVFVSFFFFFSKSGTSTSKVLLFTFTFRRSKTAHGGVTRQTLVIGGVFSGGFPVPGSAEPSRSVRNIIRQILPPPRNSPKKEPFLRGTAVVVADREHERYRRRPHSWRCSARLSLHMARTSRMSKGVMNMMLPAVMTTKK